MKSGFKEKFIIITFVCCIILVSSKFIQEDINAKDRSEIPKEQLITFDNIKAGSVSRNTFNQLGITVENWDDNVTEHVSIESDGSGDNYLSIYSPKGTYGTEDSGAQFEIELYPSTTYYSSYDIMFDSNYSWGSEYKGGKLPGLTAGGRCASECDGTDGFATRYMWRGEGKGQLYLCNLDKTSVDKCDDYYFENPDGTIFQFERGKKYNIEQYVKVNSGSNYDGEVIVAIDGQIVLDLEDIRLSTVDQGVDTFYMSSFYGGSTALWNASNDSYLYIDNIYTKAL